MSRALALLPLGSLLARRFQELVAHRVEAEGALREVWLGHVMPLTIERGSA